MAHIDDTDDGTDRSARTDRFEELLREAVHVPEMTPSTSALPHAGLEVTPQLHLIRPLGAGGMGSVWVAHHRGLDTQVAVKFMRARLDADASQSARRFEREAKMGARVKHPHVVEIHDHGTMADGTPFIVMELLEGVTLKARLNEGRLELSAVRTLVAQVAQALHAAHDKGVVHRDITPANLFIVDGHDDLFVKVLDFGVAKRRQRIPDVTSTGAMVGTPAYMSPEQLIDAREAGERSDLWGLAVVAYEALTGKLPFSGRTVAALGHAIAKGSFTKVRTLRPSLPAALDGWFSRALSVEPSRRHACASSMARAFEIAAQRSHRPLRSYAALLAVPVVVVVSARAVATREHSQTVQRSGVEDALSDVPTVEPRTVEGRAPQPPASTASRARSPRPPLAKPELTASPSASPAYCEDDDQAFYADEQGHLALKPECR